MAQTKIPKIVKDLLTSDLDDSNEIEKTSCKERVLKWNGGKKLKEYSNRKHHIWHRH